MKNHETMLLSDSYSESSALMAQSKIPNDAAKDCYNLSFWSGGMKSDKINDSDYVRDINEKFGMNSISYSVIDSDTLALIHPSDKNSTKTLQNYVLRIIDLENNDVIQKYYF